jgi:hypothetical protein
MGIAESLGSQEYNSPDEFYIALESAFSGGGGGNPTPTPTPTPTADILGTPPSGSVDMAEVISAVRRASILNILL